MTGNKYIINLYFISYCTSSGILSVLVSVWLFSVAVAVIFQEPVDRFPPLISHCQYADPFESVVLTPRFFVIPSSFVNDILHVAPLVVLQTDCSVVGEPFWPGV